MQGLVISDLHVGNPLSKWRDAVNILEQFCQKMNIVVFAGDTFDLKYLNSHNSPHNHHQILEEITLFKQFLHRSGTFHKSVFIQGNHDRPISARMFVQLATSASHVFILHGHNLGAENIAKRSDWGGRTGEIIKNKLIGGYGPSWAPYLTSKDWMIMGHSHVSYFRTHAKVIGLGCWMGDYSNPSVGTYVLIDDRTKYDTPCFNNLVSLKRYVPKVSYNNKVTKLHPILGS